MDNVVICAPVRTPVGGFLGSLASLDAADLATLVVAPGDRGRRRVVLDCGGDHFTLVELAPGVTVAEVEAVTDAPVRVALRSGAVR